MLNNLVLIGRLTDNPFLTETEEGKKLSIINIAVSRSFKNINGEYETDFFDIVLWHGIAQNVCEYLHKGDLIGIKGRLESVTKEDKKGKITRNTRIIAERVTFLSSKKEGE